MKVNIYKNIFFSSVFHTHNKEQPNHSILMMITSAEYSLKEEWVNKSKQICLVMNSKVMSLKLQVDLIRTVLP